MKTILRTVVLSSAVLLTSVNALANDDQSLSAELKALKAKVAELEAKVAVQHESATEASPAASNDITKAVSSLTEGVQVFGFVDGMYSYSFNRPKSGNNVARVFDHDSDSFTVNAAKIGLQKAASKENPVGFRVDMIAGNDAEIIHSAGLGTSSDSIDLEQAFVEISASPLESINPINFKFGKFVTLAGAEVIESKDNWNSSRGLLFGYAIPFTHTGARATYAWDNGWDLALGINNGWDVSDDNNNAKTFEGHVGFNNIALPGDSSLTVTLQGYLGAELPNNTGAQRRVGDLVAIYKTPIKALSLMYNFDYGTQEDAFENGSSADWYGHAGYIRYDLSEDWSIIGRGEFFKDRDGYRIVSGTPANYREFTGTLEYRPWKNVITRFEYRNDHANKDVFDDGDSEKDNSQNTLSGELILSF